MLKYNWNKLEQTVEPDHMAQNAWANSVDADQMQPNAASDQGLHFLPSCTEFFGHISW